MVRDLFFSDAKKKRIVFNLSLCLAEKIIPYTGFESKWKAHRWGQKKKENKNGKLHGIFVCTSRNEHRTLSMHLKYKKTARPVNEQYTRNVYIFVVHYITRLLCKHMCAKRLYLHHMEALNCSALAYWHTRCVEIAPARRRI